MKTATEFKQTEIGEIPTDWKIRTIGDLCSLKKQQVIPTDDGSRRYVGLEHLDSGRANINRWGNESGLKSSKNIFDSGDVLYGKLRPYLDKSGVAPWPGICSTDIIVLSAFKEECLPAYLGFLLHTPAFIAHANATTKGVNHPRTSWEDIKKFAYGIPAKPEQEKISKVLSRIHAAVERQENIVSNLRNLKAATMSKLFSEGVHCVPVKETELGVMPSNWNMLSVAEAVDGNIIYGYSSAIPKNGGPGVKIVSTADITKDGELLYGQVRRLEVSKKVLDRTRLQDGDVLFNWRNSPELVGKSTVFRGQSEDYIFASFILGLRCDKEKTDNHYLAYLFNYLRAKGVFMQLSRRAVNQSNYNAALVAALKIPFPPIGEQRDIAATLFAIDTKIALATTRMRVIRELFGVMLSKMMHGKIRIPEKEVV